MENQQITTSLDILLILWFSLTALSVIYVAYDLVMNTPEIKVMKWGWILVTIYLGPIALLVYWFSCREPAPGTHEQFVSPHWKQTIGSSIHCLAGDATGIIVAAIITSWLGLPMGIDIWVEYLTGFAFGLFIFQALFMKDMLGGSYKKAVVSSFLPEWLSMNAVMAGMIPVMVYIMSRDMQAMEPDSLHFWGAMSLATLAGAVLAYPINSWLVRTKLKHGMGTERALGNGGTSVIDVLASAHNQHFKKTANPVSDHNSGIGQIPGMSHGKTSSRPDGPMGNSSNHKMSGESMDTATLSGKILVTIISLLMLGSGYFLADRYGDLTMRAGEHTKQPMPNMKNH